MCQNLASAIRGQWTLWSRLYRIRPALLMFLSRPVMEFLGQCDRMTGRMR